MTARFDRNLTSWVNAIRSAPSTAFAEGLLKCFARTATEEWPTALTDIEQLDDWTHGGLIAAALEPKAPGGLVPEHSESGSFKPSFLLTVRTVQLVGKLALACEQALHLDDRKTAIQMMRLMSREWMHLNGSAALDVAFGELEPEA